VAARRPAANPPTTSASAPKPKTRTTTPRNQWGGHNNQRGWG
jgi:hypothetical protein